MDSIEVKDLVSNSTQMLWNPNLTESEKQQIEKLSKVAFDWPSHLWIATSGSSESLRFVGLAKDAFLLSAKAVNNFIGATSHDRWLLALPVFHVGGLSILARSALSSSSIVKLPFWNGQQFYEMLIKEKITLTSLVPTQIYDLITMNKTAPVHLRCVFVGGGHLNDNLYFKARELNWPLIPTYGMTEACSQIASVSLDSLHYINQKDTNESQIQSKQIKISKNKLQHKLQILSHWETSLSKNGILNIKGPSLLTAYLFLKNNVVQIYDPKIDGWFLTQDLATIETDQNNRNLIFNGRLHDCVKILGEKVYINELEERLREIHRALNGQGDLAILALPHIRNENELHLFISEDFMPFDLFMQILQTKIKPFESPHRIHRIKKIPRSPLGKILKAKLINEVNY